MSPKEIDLQREILAYLKLRGVLCWRNQAGVVFKGRVIRMAPEGSPDIVGCMPDGRFLGVEVKLPGNKLRDKQAEFLAKLKDSNAVAFVAHSVKEVENNLRRNHVTD